MASKGVPHRGLPPCYGTRPCDGCLWLAECYGPGSVPTGCADAALARRVRENGAVIRLLRALRSAEPSGDDSSSQSTGKGT